MHLGSLYSGRWSAPGSRDATLSLCPFMARRRLTYASRSLSNFVSGCSVFDQPNYSRWWRVQVKKVEWKHSDVLPEFMSGKHSQTITCSVHAVANQLAP